MYNYIANLHDKYNLIYDYAIGLLIRVEFDTVFAYIV